MRCRSRAPARQSPGALRRIRPRFRRARNRQLSAITDRPDWRQQTQAPAARLRPPAPDTLAGGLPLGVDRRSFDDSPHRQTKLSNARLTVHAVGVDGDSVETHSDASWHPPNGSSQQYCCPASRASRKEAMGIYPHGFVGSGDPRRRNSATLRIPGLRADLDVRTLPWADSPTDHHGNYHQ